MRVDGRADQMLHSRPIHPAPRSDVPPTPIDVRPPPTIVLVRIVSLVPGATETLATLGLLDRLVGVTHACDFPAEVETLPTVTSTAIPDDAESRAIDEVVKDSAAAGTPLYELDAELLEGLAPDLVVTQDVCDVCAVGGSQALSCLSALSSDPTVVRLHPHRFDDVLDDILTLGRATGTEKRAEVVVAESRARIESVVRRVGDRPPVDVVVLEWIDPPYSAGHWTPDLVELAGGRELIARPGERSRELTWDEVRRADPAVLVLACCGQDRDRALADLEHLRSLPGYEELRAVRSGRVHAADGGAHFSRPGPRLVESAELLGEMLHPSPPDGVPSAASR